MQRTVTSGDFGDTDWQTYLRTGERPRTAPALARCARVYARQTRIDQRRSRKPGGIKLLDRNGLLIEKQKQHWAKELKDFDYDLLIVGHTHQVFAEWLGDTFVVNPGSSAFNHSCMVLSLPNLTVQTFALEDQAILKSWNFSHLFGKQSDYPTARKKPRSG